MKDNAQTLFINNISFFTTDTGIFFFRMHKLLQLHFFKVHPSKKNYTQS